MERLRIAFGLDGVLADLEKGLSDLSENLFDRKLENLSTSQRRLLLRIICASENFWEHLKEIAAKG